MAEQEIARRPFHIRSAQPADAAAMIRVFRDAVRHVAIRDYSRAQVLAWAPDDIGFDDWKETYETRQAWVAVADDEIVGFTDLEADGHLDMMFVDAAHQNMGIASALYAEVEAAARSAELTRIFVEASLTARPFFERRGFRLIAQQTVSLNGQELINFRMEKLLELPLSHRFAEERGS